MGSLYDVHIRHFFIPHNESCFHPNQKFNNPINPSAREFLNVLSDTSIFFEDLDLVYAIEFAIALIDNHFTLSNIPSALNNASCGEDIFGNLSSISMELVCSVF